MLVAKKLDYSSALLAHDNSVVEEEEDAERENSPAQPIEVADCYLRHSAVHSWHLGVSEIVVDWVGHDSIEEDVGMLVVAHVWESSAVAEVADPLLHRGYLQLEGHTDLWSRKAHRLGGRHSYA